MTLTVSKILFIVAVICFILALIPLGVPINLMAAGLAFGFAGFVFQA